MTLERGRQPPGIGVLAKHVLVLSGEQNARVGMSLENARQRVQENLHPLLRRQPRRHADHGSASVEAMAVSECGDSFCVRLEDFDRWRNDLHLV